MNNLKCRKQGFNKYVCKRIGKEIKLSECTNCPYKEYKDKKCTTIVKKSGLEWKNAQKSPVYCANSNKNSRKLQSSAKMKQRSSKLAKLERNRFSLFTDDLEHCIICGKRKEHLHEVYPGAFRLRSIKEHMVLPLCSFHHRLIHNNVKLSLYWKQLGQKLFEKFYTREKFIKTFGRSYL